jgi:hypothetical protein
MIDLEHAEVFMRIAVCEGVESGAEDDVLTHSSRGREMQLILGESASRGEARPQERRDEIRLSLEIRLGDFQRQWIVEERWFIQKLMRSAARGNAFGGPAPATFFHFEAEIPRRVVK